MKLRFRQQGTSLALLMLFASTDIAGAGRSKLASLAGDLLALDVRSNDVVVVGEIHGTAEAPHFVAQLARSIPGKVLVAYELRDDTSAIDCSGKAVPSSWLGPMADGRSSIAMRDSVCEVLQLKQKGKADVLFFDTRSARQPTFYASAGDAILARYRDGKFSKVVVLTGNLHATNSGRLPERLRALGLNTVSATIAAPKGTSWNCIQTDGKSDCGIHEYSAAFCNAPKRRGPYWSAEFLAETRWDRCLVFPQFTASKPAGVEKP